MRFVYPLLTGVLVVGLPACTTTSGPAGAAERFLADHEARIRPLETALGLAWWKANVTGTDEDFAAKEAAQNRYDAALADPAAFERVKGIREALQAHAGGSDELLARQIEIVYREYLEKQLDPELLKKIAAKENAVEKIFNTYRATVNGKKLTDSAVRKILKESENPAERKAVWEANKAVGAAVEPTLKELVALRNEAAEKLGFKNYHAMQLFFAEQNQEQVIELFDELYNLTRDPFRKVKAQIDAALAATYGISPADLRPWHYHDPFFQEPQAIFDINVDAVYAGLDIPAACRRFYGSIGLPVDDVIERSDLYEKLDKSPHAFCIDIDRDGDVRVLANLVSNEYWTSTLLHELGHAVYSSKNIPPSVPYVLRTDAHALSTEGIAMMFERFGKRAQWLQAMGVTVPDPVAFNAATTEMRRHQLLIFAAWSQVMLRFEKAMYENPEQDLNTLWWDLVEKYQLVHRPEGRSAPDYAAKIHIVSSPAYYHNYLMGELFACQVHATIARDILKTGPARALYNDRPEVGTFLKEKVFAPGRSLTWNELAKHATGADLNAAAFAAEFKESL